MIHAITNVAVYVHHRMRYHDWNYHPLCHRWRLCLACVRPHCPSSTKCQHTNDFNAANIGMSPSQRFSCRFLDGQYSPDCFTLHPQAITPGQFSFSVTQKVVQAGLVAQKRTQRIVAAVFLLFLFRAAYALLFTVAFAAFDMKSDCGQCGECQSTPTVMGVWFISNPSAQIVTSFLSAPAALLLAMFGMLSNTNFQMLTRSTKLSLQMLERNSLDAFM